MKSRSHRVFAHALAAVLTAASVSTATPNDWVGAAGGGLVRLSARGSMRVDGTIRADGMMNQGTAPGGSGGAILLSAQHFSGTGELRVRGGNSHYNQHAGGGGTA